MFDAQITFLSVTDLDASSRFYTEGLGLEMVLDQQRCRIFRSAATSYIGICDLRTPDPGSSIVTLVTEDVDGVHDRLVSIGATIDVPPRANPDFQIYQLFARDPDGYVIEAQRFDDPRWSTRSPPD